MQSKKISNFQALSVEGGRMNNRRTGDFRAIKPSVQWWNGGHRDIMYLPESIEFYSTKSELFLAGVILEFELKA
jgi:hypothetical protein